MKNISLLVWLTQLVFSVGIPLGGFVLLAIWLHESCGWGTWGVWAGMILGISGAIGGLADTIRSMNRLIRTQEKKNEPPLAFNDHD